jgi:hypothetical protein
MPSNELKTDFFGLSTSAPSAAAANPTSFLPPPISHDLSDYASSLMMPPPPPPPPLASNYGHMKMVNYLLFFLINFYFFRYRIMLVVCRLHYVLVCIIHLKIHHGLVQQQHMENQMNKQMVFFFFSVILCVCVLCLCME